MSTPEEILTEELERANRKIRSLESHVRDINVLYMKALNRMNEMEDVIHGE